MGWLPSAPQLNVNPTNSCGSESRWCRPDTLTNQLKDRNISFSCLDLDAEENWPRNLFIWRSNVLGSSGKGQEIFLRHLLGTESACLGGELDGSHKELMPLMEKWRPAPRAKLDLLQYGLPHEHDFDLLRYRASGRHLLRKERYQHDGYAQLHSSVRESRSMLWGRQKRLQHSKTSPRSSLKLPPNMRTTSAASPTWYSRRSVTAPA